MTNGDFRGVLQGELDGKDPFKHTELFIQRRGSAAPKRIDIGNFGVAGESATIRIGAAQTKTFIAGIRGVTTGIANAPASDASTTKSSVVIT